MKQHELKPNAHPTRCALLSTLDGGEPSWELRRHLRDCDRCAQRFELLRRMGGALRELPHPAWLERGLRSTPELRERILERLRTETRRHLAGWLREFVAHSLVLLGHSPERVSEVLEGESATAERAARRPGPGNRAHPAPRFRGTLARFDSRGEQEAPAEVARRALVDVLVDIGRMAQRARRTEHAAQGLPLGSLPLRLPTALTAEGAVRRALAVAPAFEISEAFVQRAESLLVARAAEVARSELATRDTLRGSVPHGRTVLA